MPALSRSFNTQPPEGGCSATPESAPSAHVSTLSRPKAAGHLSNQDNIHACFNTQPPEGGCPLPQACFLNFLVSTLHSAARRRLTFPAHQPKACFLVSTLSRPKAAVKAFKYKDDSIVVSTLSRPKAAVDLLKPSQPSCLFQHSAARRRLAVNPNMTATLMLFQHSAARRRLADRFVYHPLNRGFNTQPPEGGCA